MKMSENETDRLERLEKLVERKKRNGSQLCWITPNAGADYGFDVINANEDINWMVYEIKRLQEENVLLKEFATAMEQQMSKELEKH